MLYSASFFKFLVGASVTNELRTDIFAMEYSIDDMIRGRPQSTHEVCFHLHVDFAPAVLMECFDNRNVPDNNLMQNLHLVAKYDDGHNLYQSCVSKQQLPSTKQRYGRSKLY